jgi:hypothetical protein
LCTLTLKIFQLVEKISSAPFKTSVVIFWNDSSLLSDILKDNYEKEGTLEFFKEAQNILKKQFLTNLSQWKKLTKEEKKKFPVGLKHLLDEVCGIENKVEWNYSKIFSNLKFFGSMNLNWNNIIDENNGKENVEKTIYANELLNSKEIDLGHQVKKIEMETWLQSNEKSSPHFLS